MGIGAEKAAGTGQRKVLRVAGEEMNDIHSPRVCSLLWWGQAHPNPVLILPASQDHRGHCVLYKPFPLPYFLETPREAHRCLCALATFSGTEKTMTTHSWAEVHFSHLQTQARLFHWGRKPPQQVCPQSPFHCPFAPKPILIPFAFFF